MPNLIEAKPTGGEVALPDLSPDCSRCAGLCCVAYAFDAGAGFGIDKEADSPCPNLTPLHRCKIHAQLSDRGYSGCVAYDCFGAGQRVVQELFAGGNWRDTPALLPQMTAALRALRPVHEALALLRAAQNLPLPAQQLTEITALMARLCEGEPLSTCAKGQADHRSALAEVPAFLRSLAPYVQRQT